MNNEIKFFDKYQIDIILQSVKNPKHKLIIMIMLDCGLRVSEAISLKYQDFDFKKEMLYVTSLKKRGKDKKRAIPISKRLYHLLADHLSKKSNIKGEDYLFPSNNHISGHIGRSAVSKLCDRLQEKLGFDFLNPHAFRHTFATSHISAETPLENIKTMLGHNNYDTTLIYAQIPSEILKRNVARVTEKEQSMLQKVLSKYGIINRKTDKRISINFHKDNFSIGRIDDFNKLSENANKGINTLLIGPVGIGKSHLLENFKTEKKVLKIDDLNGLKQTLAQLLLYLYKNDKEHCRELLYGDLDLDKVKVKINRLSVRNIAEEIKKTVQDKEYILVIDSLDQLTPVGVKFLEEVKDTFTIFAAARSIKIDKSSFAWNYDRVDVKELKREKAIELTAKLSYDIQVEDPILFRNHIFEQSNGNPRVIFEIIDRYRKEPVVTNEVVKNIRHTASLGEIDMTFVVFIVFGLMYLLRYMSKELDNEALRFIGGVALVLMLLSRQLLSFTKKKFI